MLRSPVDKSPAYVSRLLSKRTKTPFLALSKPLISRRVTEFRDGHPDVAIFYAFKANSDTQLIPFLDGQGVGFEVSGEQELTALLRRGVPIGRIISSNTIKTPPFIRRAYRAGMRTFAVDSIAEVDKVSCYAPGSSLLVRLTVDNSGSEWPLDKKFGADPETAIQLFRHGAELGLRPQGITFHVGSQCTETDSWSAALSDVRDLWDSLGNLDMHLGTLNLGGGFPIKYTEDVPSVSEIMDAILAQTSALFPDDVAIQVEPGRALVGDAGALVSQVIGKAQRGDQNWLYLDVGVFNGLMESLGGIRYEFHTSGSGTPKPWIVAGPSCDSMDVVARDVWIPEPAVGDYVFIPSAGAYTTSYVSRFNGCRVPDTYLVNEA